MKKRIAKVNADRPLAKKYWKHLGLTKEEMKDIELGEEDALEELVDFEVWRIAQERTNLSQQPTIDYTKKMKTGCGHGTVKFTTSKTLSKQS